MGTYWDRLKPALRAPSMAIANGKCLVIPDRLGTRNRSAAQLGHDCARGGLQPAGQVPWGDAKKLAVATHVKARYLPAHAPG
jgi:hypothetical protein